jgi:hypothetical protein
MLKNLFRAVSSLDERLEEESRSSPGKTEEGGGGGGGGVSKDILESEEVEKRKWIENNCDLLPSLVPIAMRYER